MIVTVVFYRNATKVDFANQTYDLAAQTTKYTLTVRNWPFASARNTLGITFAADTKGNVCLQSQKDSGGNVQWIKLIVPSGEALYHYTVSFHVVCYHSLSLFLSTPLPPLFFFDFFQVCTIHRVSRVGYEDHIWKFRFPCRRRGRTCRSSFLERVDN